LYRGWSVVEFLETDEIQHVPSNWIHINKTHLNYGTCWFPNTKTSKRNPKFTSTQILKMILNCMDSNECDGVYYEIKIIAGLFGK